MRENLILVRMDDREKDILIGLARYYNVSKADVIRMLVTERYRSLKDQALYKEGEDAAEREIIPIEEHD